jgi:chloramphenicol-sensitive protein RarD
LRSFVFLIPFNTQVSVTNTTEVPLTLARRETRLGLMYGLLAYLAWGLVSIYFALITDRKVDAIVLVSHRIIWAVVFLLIVITLTKQWDALWRCARSKTTMLALAGSTVMIAGNWFGFVYAVKAKLLLQASLGYYINPLVNVLLGYLFLGERLRPMQWLGVILALLGVGILTAHLGSLPWIPFVVAGTFGMYGLLRKTMNAGPLVGLTIETVLLLPIAGAIAAMQFSQDIHSQEGVDWIAYGLLMLLGVITAVPLLWFAAAARRLKLSTMGFLQYISPTMQTVVAVWYRGEGFDRVQLITFSLIWVAVILYSIDSWRALNQARSRQQAIECEKRLEIAAEIE